MKKAISWILLFFWLILIFTFSNQTGSVSTGLSDQVLSFLPKFIDSELLSFIVRKCAHFFEYFILAILTMQPYPKNNSLSRFYFVFCMLFQMNFIKFSLLVEPQSFGMFASILAEVLLV